MGGATDPDGAARAGGEQGRSGGHKPAPGGGRVGETAAAHAVTPEVTVKPWPLEPVVVALACEPSDRCSQPIVDHRLAREADPESGKLGSPRKVDVLGAVPPA